MQTLVQKWRENGVNFILCATATVPLFFALALPRRAPPFFIRASGASAQHWAKDNVVVVGWVLL